MQPPISPLDEARRLSSLQALGLLDSAADPRFDAITRAAAGVFGMPIALVSLVDENRQWFKSRHGLEAAETPRDISFCGHAILSDETLIVEDALADPRFADNPLVTGAPNVRFYAGRPLAAPDGSRIGTLCMIDSQPRKLSAEQRIGLALLGAWAEAEIALVAERRGIDRFFDHLLERTIEAVLVTDVSNSIVLANPAALALLRIARDELAGATLGSLLDEGDREALDARLAGMRGSSGEISAFDVEATLRRGDGSLLPATLCCTRRSTDENDWIVIFVRPRAR